MLVALTIMSAGIAVLFAILGQTLTRNREIESRMAARVLATRLLTQAQAAPTIQLGETAGQMKNGLAWRLDVARYGSDQDVQAWPAAAATMTATVRWGDAPNQSLSLSGLRLAPKDQKP